MAFASIYAPYVAVCRRKKRSLRQTARAYGTMGAISLDRGNNWVTALDYYEKAYAIFDSQKDMFWKLSSLQTLVSVSADKDWEIFEKYYPLLVDVYNNSKKSGLVS